MMSAASRVVTLGPDNGLKEGLDKEKFTLFLYHLIIKRAVSSIL
jgi:hypothetical protein